MAPKFAGAALVPLLSTCAMSPPRAGTGGAAASPAAAAAPDAAFDWHALIIMPFGAALNDSPRALHEVLLFHEAAEGPGSGENQECYSVDAPPRFMDDRPREYLLCFVHDRLRRIEASVKVPAAAAERACALWRSRAAPAADSAGPCAGQEDGITFSARLDSGSGGTMTTVSMTLSPAAADEAPGS